MDHLVVHVAAGRPPKSKRLAAGGRVVARRREAASAVLVVGQALQREHAGIIPREPAPAPLRAAERLSRIRQLLSHPGGNGKPLLGLPAESAQARKTDFLQANLGRLVHRDSPTADRLAALQFSDHLNTKPRGVGQREILPCQPQPVLVGRSNLASKGRCLLGL
jgi:hypothetical protein